MTGPAWLIDSKRIASKIKHAAKSVAPNEVKWISNPTKACPRCNYIIDNSDVVQEWPGLPQGVKFDPSDPELLGHLLAKVGRGNVRVHPFINEFIPTVEEDDGICYTHPQKLPGVKLDGSVSHFFHRTYKAYNSGTRKRRKILLDEHEVTGGLSGDVRWHKTGKTKPVLIDGVHVGCKKIMVLYSSLKKGGKPEKTNWVMHQYHLGTGEDEKDGEFVVSKIFYQQQQILKPSDATKGELQHVTMALRETLEAESVVTVSSEVEMGVSMQHAYAPISAVPQHYSLAEQHPGQALSNQVAMDNGTIINECEGPKNFEREKIADMNTENRENTEEESKWWEGESQFLLDSQQLAEGMALCDEFLQSQSSCGGEVEEERRMKPCLLSEYARKGGADDFKKDLEDCQTLSINHSVAAEQRTTDCGLLDMPPDMRLSQLEFESQDSFLA